MANFKKKKADKPNKIKTAYGSCDVLYKTSKAQKLGQENSQFELHTREAKSSFRSNMVWRGASELTRLAGRLGIARAHRHAAVSVFGAPETRLTTKKMMVATAGRRAGMRMVTTAM